MHGQVQQSVAHVIIQINVEWHFGKIRDLPWEVKIDGAIFCGVLHRGCSMDTKRQI